MNRLDFALAAVDQASHLARDIQRVLVDEETLSKADRSPVTVADFAAQAAISLSLGRDDPETPILGEESATFLRTPAAQTQRDRVIEAVRTVHPDASATEILDAIDRCRPPGDLPDEFWTLDPIDGTKGFLRRGQYAVALALVRGGQVQLGVLGCPNLPGKDRKEVGYLFAARRGEGATQRPLGSSRSVPVRVSDLEKPTEAAFLESVEAAHSAHSLHARIAARLGITAPSVRMDSQCKYAALARAEGEIYLRLPRDLSYQEKIWDHAAGALLVEEAGGRVTDAQGRPLDFSAGETLARNSGIVATHGRFHERVIKVVEEVVEETSTPVAQP